MSPSFISAYEGESSYSVMDSGILRHFASLLVRLGWGGGGQWGVRGGLMYSSGRAGGGSRLFTWEREILALFYFPTNFSPDFGPHPFRSYFIILSP